MINLIRNFSIIAHIDHGKSTLADRMLEITGTKSMREMKDRILDTLELEQERGITIKLQTVRMKWKYTGSDPKYQNKEFILNLIDTPGHVDFSYEVSRSLAACEGAILLVDATQGIQAQTLSTIFQAWENNLEVIPVLNKIDLPAAEPEKRKTELTDYLGFKEEEIYFTSGKTGEGVEKLLNRIVEKVPPPDTKKKPSEKQKSDENPLKALIFDSFFDDHKGVVALVKIIAGNIEDFKQGKKLFMIQKDNEFAPIEVGYLSPTMVESKQIFEGEVGYIATGLKDIKKVGVGDTISDRKNIEALAGYKKIKPVVYASLYPIESNEFEKFRESLEKLALSDSSIEYKQENSKALGFGFRCGFLGLLHMEIVQERLAREFNTNILLTTPSVEYEVVGHKGSYLIHSAIEFPEDKANVKIKEPWVTLEIITPQEYIGEVMKLCQEKRGVYKNTKYITNVANISPRVIMTYEIPLSEIIINFFNKLKSATQGYASMDYHDTFYKESDIVKVNILVNKEIVEPLSFLVHEDSARYIAGDVLKILRDSIPKHQFAIPLQAAIDSKVIAREDISAYRKDVIAKLYGGDVTRKNKLLDKQKKGKKKMKEIGKVSIPQEAFLNILKR